MSPRKIILTVTVVVTALLLSTSCIGAIPVTMKLSGRNIPPLDPFGGNSDAYAIVSYAYGTSEQFDRVGQTSSIADSANPDWSETFDFGFVPGTSQRLRFELFDEDFDDDDFIGSVEFFLAELSNAPNATLTKPINPAGNGELIIRNIAE